MIDGFSRSAWRSLAVKSLRMGWPAGLARAQAALLKSEMRGLLACGFFEDVFPAVSELPGAFEEVKRFDYAALCRRETHHGRGLTAEFCSHEQEATEAARSRSEWLYSRAKELRLFLPPRGLNVFFTWLSMQPEDAGITRAIDDTPWTGMPEAVLDHHTFEGKCAGRKVTILSGDYSQHLAISIIVAAQGWEGIRRQVHASPVHRPAQGDLFS